MAEPSTTTIAVASAAGVGFASLFPGVDGNALIGAFAGASLLVVNSKDINIPQRITYLVISLIVGYLGAPDVVNNVTVIRSTGVAAFLVSASAITVTLQLLERLKNIDLLSFFGKKGKDE
ncbi:hypothetical protein GTP45_27490 [Pseudoduganella sp. FT55W]|uniref:Phage holin n=1 Tax=Duganella rivi TaxID=2666083 RepID=A0A7X4GVT5_9BURK|nr:putative holin [Duganella rivi]MYM70526.1 hypothetical protein [Duganella rivi]